MSEFNMEEAKENIQFLLDVFEKRINRLGIGVAWDFKNNQFICFNKKLYQEKKELEGFKFKLNLDKVENLE